MKDVAHFVIGIFGNASALFLFLAPMITFRRILKKRSTEEFSGIPYVMALLNCLLSLWYGLPFVSPHNLLLATINGIGVAIESIYVLIFLIFAPKKEKLKILVLLTMVLALFAAVVFTSLFALHGKKRKIFCGITTTTFSMVMYASPLTIIGLVIKTKSVEFMPFFLSLFVFVCGTLWMVYGLLGKDPFIATPNGFAFGIGAVQLILYAIYHDNKSKAKAHAADKTLELEQENSKDHLGKSSNKQEPPEDAQV